MSVLFVIVFDPRRKTVQEDTGQEEVQNRKKSPRTQQETAKRNEEERRQGEEQTDPGAEHMSLQGGYFERSGSPEEEEGRGEAKIARSC